MNEYTLPVSRLRADYIAMREQHYGFVDLYAEEWDRAMAAHDAEVAATALREFGDALQAVPDHAPSPYDRGRVDQRHTNATEAFERADQIRAETKEQGS